MNVEIGAEAALFPEKEYINGNAVAVHGCFLQGRHKVLWMVFIINYVNFLYSGCCLQGSYILLWLVC